MKNLFNTEDVKGVIARINNLTEQSRGRWGKMSVSQMLAHSNVTYEMVYDNVHPKPNAVKRFLLKTFVKPMVVSEKPYKPNLRTAPEFLIVSDKDFAKEKARLIAYIEQTLTLGASHFEGKKSHSFGRLTHQEWNNMFSKHLDHHLSQFGV